MNGIGLKLPLARSHTDGTFELIKTFREEIKQNFKNLLLTSPGERIMIPDFGVGLRNYLFEPKIDVTSKITKKIHEQVSIYMPYVQIDDILFDFNGSADALEEKNILSVRIEFQVPSFNLNSTILIDRSGVAESV